MIVENAKISDIDSLTELRLAYLKEDYGNISEDDIKKIRQALPDYFKKNLNHNIYCYVIKENEKTSIRCRSKKSECCRTQIHRRWISLV